jgi:hypothetical protein
MPCNYGTKELKIVIISGEFVAEQLSTVPSAEAKSWWPQI